MSTPILPSDLTTRTPYHPVHWYYKGLEDKDRPVQLQYSMHAQIYVVPQGDAFALRIRWQDGTERELVVSRNEITVQTP